MRNRHFRRAFFFASRSAVTRALRACHQTVSSGISSSRRVRSGRIQIMLFG
jgi:hypothetical protein